MDDNSMITILITTIQLLSRLIFLVIIAQVLVSYVLSPYHPVRTFLDRLVEPLLKPIRKVVPPLQMIDFSPLILIVLVQIIAFLLVSILSGMG
jgi:YggT family protein